MWKVQRQGEEKEKRGKMCVCQGAKGLEEASHKHSHGSINLPLRAEPLYTVPSLGLPGPTSQDCCSGNLVPDGHILRGVVPIRPSD